MVGLVALYKGEEREPSENTVRRWVSVAKNRDLTRNPSCQHFDLGLPASCTVRE